MKLTHAGFYRICYMYQPFKYFPEVQNKIFPPRVFFTEWFIFHKPQTGPAHYIDVIMTTIASQITSLTLVYPTDYSDVDQGKHQSSASLAFVWGIHRDRWIPHTKGQLRGKCFHLMTSSCVSHSTSTTIYLKILIRSRKHIIIFLSIQSYPAQPETSSLYYWNMNAELYTSNKIRNLRASAIQNDTLQHRSMNM